MGSRRIKSHSTAPTHGGGPSEAFTLIELLVVIAIIALLASITLPVAAKARQKVKHLLNKNNMKQITTAVTLFGTENNDKFPPSLAYIRSPSGLTGSDPRNVIVPDATSPTRYRALSEYLGSYIPDAKTIYCPNAPKYPYLQEMWDARSKWDHPTQGTSGFLDPFVGAYCFWWNYTGYLPKSGKRFEGPTTISRAKGESRVMVTDYFGRNHWKTQMGTLSTGAPPVIPSVYGSCEPFKHSTPTDPDYRAASHYQTPQPSADMWSTPLLAGLIDTSVKEDYTPAKSDVLQVLSNPENPQSTDVLGNGLYGDYFIPRQAVRSR